MLFSKPTKYAIRALIALAQSDRDSMAFIRQTAKELEIPYYFLAKILQKLVKAGILKSSKGVSGGVALGKAPKKIKIIDIINLFEKRDFFKQCLLTGIPCNKNSLCSLHPVFSKNRDELYNYLKGTSLKDISNGHSLLDGKAEKKRGRKVRPDQGEGL